MKRGNRQRLLDDLDGQVRTAWTNGRYLSFSCAAVAGVAQARMKPTRLPVSREEFRKQFETVEAAPPAWLKEAVETVLPGLQRPPPLHLDVSYHQRKLDGSWVVDLSGSRMFVLQPAQGADLLVDIALYLHEHVFDTDPVWGQAQPVCPGHPHPPDPRVIDGEAVCSCPLDGHLLTTIGHLA
jgi:hypothetical protein